MPPQALAAVATLLAFAQHGNRVELRLDHGSAELVWVSPSTFHFRRALEGPLSAAAQRAQDESVDLHIEEDPGAVRVRSRLLEVTLRKRGLLVTVQRLGGGVLMADLSEPAAVPSTPTGGVAWERQAPPGVRFYGLGPRTDPSFDLRGQSVRAENPLLLSTAGYGEYHAGSGPFQFDFTSADRYRVEAPSVDYYFCFGLTPKQIFEQANPVRGPLPLWKVAVEESGTWSTLQASLLRLVHAAISGMGEPALGLTPYAGAPPDLRERVRQSLSLVPGVGPGPIGLSEFRGKLGSFLTAYAIEARDRGFPLWHPLPFQFPDDPECARHADEFLLGDEMLVAPICQPGNRRSVYLPPGIWTSLETNAVSNGRRTITVDTPSLPLFARNGSIVPLDVPGEMELHYFPTLGAEFFLLETDVQDWTQVHAAPAADVMRLEIEAKTMRTYQWVVHHVERPGGVGFEERRYSEAPSLARLQPGAWFWDANRKNLHIRLRAEKGQDAIVNVAW